MRALIRSTLLVMCIRGAAALHAQEPDSIRQGAMLRLTPRGGNEYRRPVVRTATLLGADTANVWVTARARGRVDTIPYFQLQRIELRTGSHSRRSVVVAGAAIGASCELIASLIDAHFYDVKLSEPANRRKLTLYMLRGVAWGAVIGAIVPTERWQPVDPPLQVSPTFGSTPPDSVR